MKRVRQLHCTMSAMVAMVRRRQHRQSQLQPNMTDNNSNSNKTLIKQNRVTIVLHLFGRARTPPLFLPLNLLISIKIAYE